jgi:superfamily II DNA/RNA helicase
VSADTTFLDLGLPESMVRVLARSEITLPTAVQAAVLPDAMAGRDVLGRAATGSGKTLAFGLPILARLAGTRSKPKSPRALIIVPTRELALQVRSSLEPVASAVGVKLATVYGGTPYDRQIKRLRAGADLVVATPGRLRDLIDRGACKLDRIEVTVLDEADHLCDLGFYPEVTALVAMTPPDGQRMLLSATLDGDVDRLVREHLTDAVRHDCDAAEDTPDIDHHVLVTGPHNKLETVANLLKANPRSIVFTRTRHGATTLAEQLADLGVRTVDLHGALSQNTRERNLRKFRSGQADAIVATDIAARGIHVDGVNLVMHFDAPTEQKAYLHRSGRTARAGASGTVVTMTTSRQAGVVAKLQKAAGVSARHHDARTAPHPLTAESLALSGIPAEEMRQNSTSSGGSRSGAPRKHTTRRTGSSPGAPRQTNRRESPSRSDRTTRYAASRADEGASRPDRSVVARDIRRRGRTDSRSDSRTGSSSGLPSAKPASRAPAKKDRTKKARWTAADRKARQR